MTKTLDELLDNLETSAYESDFVTCEKIRAKIKEALMSFQDGAQPAVAESHKQEPEFWMDSLDIEHRTPTIITNEDKREGHLSDWRCIHPVYTTPPQRTWVGLTDKEKQRLIDIMPYDPRPSHCMLLINAIEAKLKEKNT